MQGISHHTIWTPYPHDTQSEVDLPPDLESTRFYLVFITHLGTDYHSSPAVDVKERIKSVFLEKVIEVDVE
jgi:hypothetical protein